MITNADLKTQSKTQLGRLAKGLGVAGWESMRKEDLVALLLKKNKAKGNGEKGKPAPAKASGKVEANSKTSVKGQPVAAKSSTSSKKASPVKPVAAKDSVAKSASAKVSPAKQAEKPADKKAAVKVVAEKKEAAKKEPEKKTAEKAASKSALAKSTLAKPVAAKSVPAKGTPTNRLNDLKSTGGMKSSSAVKNTGGKIDSDVGKATAAKPAATKPTVAKDVASKEAAKGTATTSKEVAKKNIAAVAQPGMKPKPMTPAPAADAKNSRTLARIRRMQEEREHQKDLSQAALPMADPNAPIEKLVPNGGDTDRVILIVRDPYWLQASWDIGRRSVERARAAMAEHWHTARPILRLLTLGNSGTTDASETIDRDIEIHGGVRNWYIDVKNPPGSYRVLLGYLAANGRFHTLCKSNIIRTPAPGSADAVDSNWSDIAQDCERIFALSGGYSTEHESTELQEVFEDRLKRPLGGPPLAQFGSGAEGSLKRKREFQFEIDAEMILFGSTQSDAYVTLGGEPVKIRDDGSFSVRIPLPDRRQVLPAVASSRDGVEQRTIVIAVERNTKVMEPLSKETEE